MAARMKFFPSFRSFLNQRNFATSQGTFELLAYSNQNGVYNIHLNAPRTRYICHTWQSKVVTISCTCRNALSLQMLTELSTAFKRVNQTKDARCVLLSAEGKVFSAGHNLKELVKR